jgi:hypothetical protein
VQTSCRLLDAEVFHLYLSRCVCGAALIVQREHGVFPVAGRRSPGLFSPRWQQQAWRYIIVRVACLVFLGKRRETGVAERNCDALLSTSL